MDGGRKWTRTNALVMNWRINGQASMSVVGIKVGGAERKALFKTVPMASIVILTINNTPLNGHYSFSYILLYNPWPLVHSWTDAFFNSSTHLLVQLQSGHSDHPINSPYSWQSQVTTQVENGLLQQSAALSALQFWTLNTGECGLSIHSSAARRKSPSPVNNYTIELLFKEHDAIYFRLFSHLSASFYN